MKKNKWFVTLIIFVSIISLTVTSCKKQKATEEENEKAGTIFSTEQETSDTTSANESNEKKYKVNFKTNGGTPIAENSYTIIESEPVTTRKNCAFEGWYLDSNFTTKAKFPLKLESNITLYAKWILLYLPAIGGVKAFTFTPNILNQKTFDIDCKFGYDQLDKVADLGYKIKITITYKVHYHRNQENDWMENTPSAPTYTIEMGSSIENKKNKEELTAPKTIEERKMEIIVFPVELKYGEWNITFTTEDKQNRIYFEDYEIFYDCIKQ